MSADLAPAVATTAAAVGALIGGLGFSVHLGGIRRAHLLSAAKALVLSLVPAVVAAVLVGAPVAARLPLALVAGADASTPEQPSAVVAHLARLAPLALVAAIAGVTTTASLVAASWGTAQPGRAD